MILFITHDQVEERTKVLVKILEVFRDKYDISLRTNATIIFGWGAFGQAKINQPCPPTQGRYCQSETGEWVYLHLFLFTPCICFYSSLICFDLPPVYVFESTFASTASSKWLLTDLEFVLHHSPQPSFVLRNQE